MADPSVLQGACVQALEVLDNPDYMNLPPNCPVVCHFINEIPTVTFLTDEQWERMERGTPIKGAVIPQVTLNDFAFDVWKDMEMHWMLLKGEGKEKRWEENKYRTSYGDSEF